MSQERAGLVLLYDGLCGFCDGAVQFLLARDRKRTLLFAPLQGTFAAGLFERHPELKMVDSLMLVRSTPFGEAVQLQSDVVIELARYLGWPWRVFVLIRIVPRPIRDWAYNRFAGVRYRWFGQLPACRIPTDAERLQFIE